MLLLTFPRLSFKLLQKLFSSWCDNWILSMNLPDQKENKNRI